MDKKLMWALILIGLSAIVFILNLDRLSLNFGFWNPHWRAAFVYLGFVTDGVVIGLLLK